MAYNENPNPENLKQKDFEIIEEEIRQRRKSWIRRHMTAIYIVAGVLVAALIFIGIRVFNDNSNPMTRFINSSAKDLGSSFSFDMTADKNGETMMTYSGTLKADPSAQTLTIVYDAKINDHDDYEYTNVLYTDRTATTYKGNYYNGQWTISDSTGRVNEYYDFYNDYKHGRFDGGAFTRFTELNNYLYSEELEKFMDIVKSRLSGNSSMATVAVTRENGYTSYDYDINIEEAFDLIKEKGAPVFYSSPDYNNFVAKFEANKENIRKASCGFSFTVDPSGYMEKLSYKINTGKDEYTVECVMKDFGNAEPEIPEGFFDAAGIKDPDK